MAGMPGGGGAKAAEDDDPSVVVIWNPSNQKEIVQTHFNLATSQSIPSTLEVLYAQEDLWVFENLMNIIRATNEGAVRKHEANIRYIDYVRIGKSAGDVTGQITLLGNNNSSSSGVGGMPGMPGGAAGGMPGMPAGAGGGMPGMPTAAARCIGPLSWPKNTRPYLSSAAATLGVSFPQRLSEGPLQLRHNS